jgi:hypothetical protein
MDIKLSPLHYILFHPSQKFQLPSKCYIIIQVFKKRTENRFQMSGNKFRFLGPIFNDSAWQPLHPINGLELDVIFSEPKNLHVSDGQQYSVDRIKGIIVL